MTWQLTTRNGYVDVPTLPNRDSIEGLSPTARKTWDGFLALARQHADLLAERARVEGIEVPQAEQSRHDAAVESVRRGEPVTHGPTVGALHERAARLQLEADAVAVVLAEAYQALGVALVADQPKILAKALDRFNGIAPEDWRARCEAAVLAAWCAGLEHDGVPPATSPLDECERHADVLTRVPVGFVATAVEPVAHLLAANETTAA